LSRWVSFRDIKNQIRMEDVLGMYGVRLNATGAGLFRGLCPLPMHESASENSFSIDARRNIWACHSQSCMAARGNVGGNVLDFVASMQGCSIREAALLLQDRFSVPINGVPLVREERAVPVEVNQVLRFRLSNLRPQHPYLIGRGVDLATACHFGIGYYDGPGLMANRVVIPIHNDCGKLVAYAGRAVADGDQPKYRFPSRFRKSLELFNLHRIQGNGTVVVVEGFFDCVRVYQSGFRNVVAVMGCTISTPQIRQLKRACSSVVLLLDGDSAGRKGADAIARRLDGKAGVAVVQLPDGRQSDNLTAAELRELLSKDYRP
jgi:DNA primase